jgi:RNA polymerase sigma-70 factor (ECF subfamily)
MVDSFGLIPFQVALPRRDPVKRWAIHGNPGEMMAGPAPDAPDFERLWPTAVDAVAGLVRGLVGDRQAADDLVQEVAVQAYHHLDRWRGDGTFAGWCLGIARNCVRMHWRNAARGRAVSRDPALLDTLVDEAAALAAEDDAAAEHEALRACLEALPPGAWALVQLHYVQDLTPSAIAARTAAAPGAVRVRLHRIRAALRTCIERRIAAGGTDG